MLYYLLMTLYIIACLVLILFVLLQPGKSDAAAVFGGGANSTAFGPRGTQTVLAKITIGAAIVFFLIAFLFAIPGWNVGKKSVGETVPAETAPPPPAPAAPTSEEAPSGTPPAGAAPSTEQSGNALPGSNSGQQPATPQSQPSTAQPGKK